MTVQEQIAFSRRAALVVSEIAPFSEREAFRAASAAAADANGRDSLAQPYRDWYDNGAPEALRRVER